MTTWVYEPIRPTTDAPAVTGSALGRRSLLASAGLAGLNAVVAGSGLLGFRVFHDGVVDDAGYGVPYDAWDHWDTDPGPVGAVAAAILTAPNSLERWTFRVRGDSIAVHSEPARLSGAVDPLCREHHVGLGRAVENLVLGLAARDYQPDATLLPDPARTSHLAQVRFVRGSTVPSLLYRAVGDRHCDRGPDPSTALPAGTLHGLGGLAQDLPAVTVHWLTQERDRTALDALVADATGASAGNRPQPRDAVGWPTARRAIAELRLDRTGTAHTATAAAYGVLTVTDPDDIRARLAGGRLLQRIHLYATSRQLRLQPLTQITERIDQERASGAPASFAPRLQQILARPGRVALVAFRLGRPQRAGGTSPRCSMPVAA